MLFYFRVTMQIIEASAQTEGFCKLYVYCGLNLVSIKFF